MSCDALWCRVKLCETLWNLVTSCEWYIVTPCYTLRCLVMPLTPYDVVWYVMNVWYIVRYCVTLQNLVIFCDGWLVIHLRSSFISDISFWLGRSQQQRWVFIPEYCYCIFIWVSLEYKLCSTKRFGIWAKKVSIKSTLFSTLLFGIFVFPTVVVSNLISVSFETPIVYQFPLNFRLIYYQLLFKPSTWFQNQSFHRIVIFTLI